MATVTKPLALNESLNSTENTPRNIADVLADELDGIKQAINSQSGSGNGHIIQNSSGANMPSENTMQFVDAHLSDDNVGGKTVVETFKTVTEAEYSSETEDGAYIITDGDGAVIEPASEDYVEVTADGVKTYATLLNELYALVDKSKLNNNSYMRQSSSYTVYKYASHNDSSIKFFYVGGSTSNYDINLFQLGTNQEDNLYIGYSTSTSSTAINNVSSNIVPNGRKLTLYYGNKKATVDLQTTAGRCLMDGTNVRSIINGGDIKSGRTNTYGNVKLYDTKKNILSCIGTDIIATPFWSEGKTFAHITNGQGTVVTLTDVTVRVTLSPIDIT